MSDLGVTIIGAAGTVLSALSLAPQVFRTWRTRSASDISAAWLIIALVSMMIWISYGALVGAPAIVWANALTSIQASIILFIKLRGRPMEAKAGVATR